MSGKIKQKRTGRRSLSHLFLSEQGARTGRALSLWLLSALAAYVLVISINHIRSLDIWWHLETGKWILAHHAIPKSDPFSHTANGQPWVSHEWLFGLLGWFAYAGAGVPGLVAAKSILIVLLFALVAWISRLRGASAGMTLLVLAAGYEICRFRFTERPELLSLPLAACFLLLNELSEKHPRMILCLPLLQWLWVNVHGGTALLGWVMAGAILLDKSWPLLRGGEGWGQALQDPGLRLRALVALGVVALSFLNPHGGAALFYGLIRAESPLDNKEFQSLPEMIGQGWDLGIVLFLAYAVLLLYFCLRRPREVRAQEWLLFPFLFLLSVVFFRFRTLLVFLMAPSLAANLSRGRHLGRLRWWLPVAASTFMLFHTALAERAAYFYRFGPGIHSGIFPVQLVEFIRQNNFQGQLFNTYGLGGYLIWSLEPHYPVFIDGREDVYLAAGVLEEYLHAFDSKERWERLCERYGINLAVVRYPERPPTSLESSPETVAFPRSDWALVYFDDVAAVYARRTEQNRSVIQNHEIEWVQPLQISAYLDEIVRDPEKLRAFLNEIGKNLRSNPESFRAHFILGVCAIKQGRDHYAEAVREFETVIRLNPDFAPAFFNLSSLYFGLGRRADGERARERALSLER